MHGDNCHSACSTVFTCAACAWCTASCQFSVLDVHMKSPPYCVQGLPGPRGGKGVPGLRGEPGEMVSSLYVN